MKRITVPQGTPTHVRQTELARRLQITAATLTKRLDVHAYFLLAGANNASAAVATPAMACAKNSAQSPGEGAHSVSTLGGSHGI